MNKMEILFLGTSAGWPLPRLNCQCPICQSTDPKDKRWRPSVLIDQELLIDAGPDFYHQYLKFQDQLKNLKYIFLSHNHPDHFFGLWDVAKIYRTQPKIFLSATNKEKLSKRLDDLTINLLLSEAKTYTNGQEIKLSKNLTLTPFLVDHSSNTETYGFLIKGILLSPGTSRLGRSRSGQIIYIPDFRSIPRDSLNYLKNADLAILDGSTFEPVGPHRFGHMTMRESLKLAKKLKIGKVYYTHLGHGPKMGTHLQLESKLQKITGKNFHFAYDGLEVEV